MRPDQTVKVKYRTGSVNRLVATGRGMLQKESKRFPTKRFRLFRSEPPGTLERAFHNLLLPNSKKSVWCLTSRRSAGE